jgi:hypothetical protein
MQEIAAAALLNRSPARKRVVEIRLDRTVVCAANRQVAGSAFDAGGQVDMVKRRSGGGNVRYRQLQVLCAGAQFTDVPRSLATH